MSQLLSHSVASSLLNFAWMLENVAFTSCPRVIVSHPSLSTTTTRSSQPFGHVYQRSAQLPRNVGSLDKTSLAYSTCLEATLETWLHPLLVFAHRLRSTAHSLTTSQTLQLVKSMRYVLPSLPLQSSQFLYHFVNQARSLQPVHLRLSHTRLPSSSRTILP